MKIIFFSFWDNSLSQKDSSESELEYVKILNKKNKWIIIKNIFTKKLNKAKKRAIKRPDT